MPFMSFMSLRGASFAHVSMRATVGGAIPLQSSVLLLACARLHFKTLSEGVAKGSLEGCTNPNWTQCHKPTKIKDKYIYIYIYIHI